MSGVLAGSPMLFPADMPELLIADDDRDGLFVATDTFSTVYGAGESEIAAIQDYHESLVFHFVFLEENAEFLSPGLQMELVELRRFIRLAPGV